MSGADPRDAAAKIAAYEELLNERLKVELQQVHDERARRQSHTCRAHRPRASRAARPLSVRRRAPSAACPLRSAGDGLHEQISQLLELRNNVTTLQEQKQRSLKTMVNLGGDFYVQAAVPDTRWIYVSVGLGFHAEMSLDEAVTFCTQREAALNGSVEALTDRAARLKARIKLVVGAIDELMATQQQQGAAAALKRASEHQRS